MNNPTDGAVFAPVTRTPEKQGGTSVPYTHHYPQIRAGVCEYCGTIDHNVPPEYQYKLCPHFRGMGEIECSYCPATKNPVEVVRNSTLNVHVHPLDPNKVVVVCNSFQCSTDHLKRFSVNR